MYRAGRDAGVGASVHAANVHVWEEGEGRVRNEAERSVGCWEHWVVDTNWYRIAAPQDLEEYAFHLYSVSFPPLVTVCVLLRSIRARLRVARVGGVFSSC